MVGMVGLDKERRRKYLIKSRFQLKFIAVTFAFFFLAGFLAWWEVFLTFKRLLHNPELSLPHQQLTSIINLLEKTIAFKIILGLLLTVIIAFFLSHYLAGPLYRLEESLKKLGGGHLGERLFLRRRDIGRETAESFNQAAVSLETKIKNLAKIINENEQQISPELRSRLRQWLASEFPDENVFSQKHS